MQHHNFVKAGIQKLSQPQIKKLLSGGNVRVKHGSFHQIPMTHEQHNRLMIAHKKGSGTTLTAHSHKHAEMLGGSLLDKIKSGFKSVGKVLGKTVVHSGADFLKRQPLLSPISGLIDKGENFINHKIDGLGLRRRRVVTHRRNNGGALLAAGYGVHHKKRHTLKKRGGAIGRASSRASSSRASSRRSSVKRGRGVEGDEEENEEDDEYSDNDYSEDSGSESDEEDDYEPSSYKPSKKGGYIM
jgi:hypothetical protein